CPRNHPEQVFHTTHLFDLLYLTQKVIKTKLILGNFLMEFPSFLFIVLLLSSLYKRHNIPHSQNTISHTSRIEYIYCVHFLPSTDKFDRLVYHRFNRQRRPTSSISIEFGKNNTIEV